MHQNPLASRQPYDKGLPMAQVQGMALATVATSRQTRAMLDQKRLALKFGLPQYIGFENANPSAPGLR